MPTKQHITHQTVTSTQQKQNGNRHNALLLFLFGIYPPFFRRYAAEDIIMSRGCRAAYIHVAASGVAELLLLGPCDVV